MAAETASRYRWTILLLAFLGQMSNALIIGCFPPIAPLVQSELGLSRAEVGMFSSAAFAGTWGLLLISGALTDRLGVRRMMGAGQSIAGAVMLSIGIAGGFVQALVVMALAGVGRAWISPGVTKAVMDWFPPRTRATAMGIKQAGMPVAGILAAATLPALGLAFGWRAAVASVGLLILAFGVLTALFYRDPSQAGKPSTKQGGVRSGVVGVLRNHMLWTVSLVNILYVCAQLGLVTYIALYLSEIVLPPSFPDTSARLVVAGWFLAVSQAGGVVGRVSWGVVSDRMCHGRRMEVLTLVGLLAAAFAWCTSLLDSQSPLWVMGVVVFGFGATAIGWNGVVQAVIVESVEKSYAGTAVGVSMTLSQIGTVAGAPLFGLVVDVTGSYHYAWTMLCGFCIAGAFLSWVGARRERCIE